MIKLNHFMNQIYVFNYLYIYFFTFCLLHFVILMPFYFQKEFL